MALTFDEAAITHPCRCHTPLMLMLMLFATAMLPPLMLRFRHDTDCRFSPSLMPCRLMPAAFYAFITLMRALRCR